MNRHRFLKHTQILRNPSTSEGSKKFSRGLVYTLWVSRRSAWIRAFERTYFHDHSMRRSKNFAIFRFFCEKTPAESSFESHFSIWRKQKYSCRRVFVVNFCDINRGLKNTTGLFPNFASRKC